MLTIYILSLIVTIFIYSNFFFKARKSELYIRFIVVQALVVLWTYNKIMVLISPNNHVAWIFTVFQYFSVCFLGAFALEFGFQYFHGKRINPWIRFLIYSITAVNYLVLITNPLHHFFFSEFTRKDKSYGYYFYIHTSYSYLLIGLTFMYLIWGVFKNQDIKGIFKKCVFSLGFLFPSLFSILHVTKVTNLRLDLTPVMFNLSFVIFAYLSYRHQFIDIRMVARDVVFENLFEGILVVDSNMKIIRFNSILVRTLGRAIKLRENMEFADCLEACKPYMINYEEVNQNIQDFAASSESYQKIHVKSRMIHDEEFILEMHHIHVGREQDQYLVLRFIDVTKYYEAINELKKINFITSKINNQLSEELIILKKLSVTKERNRISKDLHDALGHSLTLVISLLELSKKAVSRDRNHAKEKIQLTRNIIRDGYIDLKQVFESQTAGRMDAEGLCEDIELLAKKIASLDTSVEIVARHNNPILEKKQYETIYRICQEALTNSIRHGVAKRITIGLRINQKGYDLIIADEGLGCKDFVKGNGLLGIEQRVHALGGDFSCGSPEGQGFSMHIHLP